MHRSLDACCLEPKRVPADAVDAQVELSRQDTDTAYLQSTRSLCSMMLRPVTSATALGWIEEPVVLLHGDRDTLVPLVAARRMSSAHPDWRFEVARGVGHAPMLEAPGWSVKQITEWMTH